MARTLTTQSGQGPDQIELTFRHLQVAVADQLLATGSDKAHANIAIEGTTTKDKTSNAIYGVINGALFTKAATDNFWTLAGSVTNAKFNVFCLTIDVAGAAHAYMGTEAATLAAVTLPAIGQGELMLGMVIINPTGTGPFVGGTTPLGDATVVPNAVYLNTAGDFNPNMLTLPNNTAI